jgi:hypothetical protein
MSRAILPARREAETFEFDCRGLRYTATLGRHVNGQPAELFLSCHKQSSPADTDARDAAILISFALQHGATVETLANAMSRDASGAPQGLAGAALDAIAQRQEALP